MYRIYTTNEPEISVGNSSSTPLLAGQIFTGVGELNDHPDVMVSCQTDSDATLFFDFSIDGTNWGAFPVNGFTVAAGIHEFHVAVKGERYFRVRLVNGASPQTYLRLQTIYGTYNKPNVPLNQSISPDSDATTTRAVLAGELTDGLLQNTGNFQNVDLTQFGEINTSIAPRVIFEYKSPEDSFIPSGSLPVIDPVLNTEPNVVDSGWIPVKQWGGGQFLHLISNTSLQVFLLNASDNLGSNLQGSSSPAISNLPGFPGTIGAPFFDNYFRLLVVNTSGIASTTMSIRSSGYQTAPPPIYTTLNNELADFFPAPVVRAIPSGRQPDGDYVNVPADGTAFTSTTLLLASQTFTSAWYDTDGWNTIRILIKADQLSDTQGCKLEFTDDVQSPTPTVIYTKEFDFKQADIDRGYLEFSSPVALDGFRLVYTNGLVDQGMFFIDVSLRTNADSMPFNSGGALVTSNYGLEVVQGNVSNYKVKTIRGRNPSILSGTQEDVVGNGGDYVGQPTTASPELMNVVSTSILDNSLGDGARTVRIYGLKSPTSTEIETEDITLAGTTPVLTANTWWRIEVVEVITGGTLGSNQGDITVVGATSLLNYSFIESTFGLNTSTNCVGTVPAGKKWILVRPRVSITRTNGSAGSATCNIQYRPNIADAVFRGIPLEVQTGQEINFTFEGGIVFDEGTDIKVRIEDVSDNTTIADVALEFYEITK